MNRGFQKFTFILFLFCIFFVPFAKAQQPAVNPKPDPRFKADILVVAAHPDDESMIAGYLAKAVFDEHKKVEVVFATRGNAGQNLVGNEQDHSLAEIREMEARQACSSIGIHNVWFLRAPDTPAPAGDVHDVLRSLETWNHGNVLGEIVRFIRLTRPEVVITMLPDVVVGENHEDHQATGVIATEAFDMAGDPTKFPEQVAAPEDRLWFGNHMEGLRTWQPEKLYYFTDASQLGFVKGRGPEYSMKAVSPSKHVAYGRLAAQEISYHKTQYGDKPSKALASGNLDYYEQPLTFILGKSLVGGTKTGDIFQGVKAGPILFAPVKGYQPPKNNAEFSLELGGPWAFYKRFYPAHDLKNLADLLAPEIGVGGGQDFPIPLVLHNNSDKTAIFHLQTHFPQGWSIDSSSAQYAHRELPVHTFKVNAHDSFPIRIRLIAPNLNTSKWQNISWAAEADGKKMGSATLKVYVR